MISQFLYSVSITFRFLKILCPLVLSFKSVDGLSSTRVSSLNHAWNHHRRHHHHPFKHTIQKPLLLKRFSFITSYTGIDLSLSSFPSTTSSPNINDAVVVELLSYLNDETQNRQLIDECIEKLEIPYVKMQENANFSDDDSVNEDHNMNQFQSLTGWYDVKYVKTSRPNDNPVGGKWTRKNNILRKILRLEKAYQHLLPLNFTGLGKQFIDDESIKYDGNSNQSDKNPVVGEAINVVVFQALWGLLSLYVILRGDAIGLTNDQRLRNFITTPVPRTITSKWNRTKKYQQPEQKLFKLSSLTVRALFDPPRIVIISNKKKDEPRLWMNLMLGPKSSVVLDTSYMDRNVRIGVGGRSGTRFVFQKCLSPKEIEQAKSFQSLLQYKPWKKEKAILSFASISMVGSFVAWKQQFTPLRFMFSSLSIITTIFMFLLLFSTGGIEDRRVRNQKQATTSSLLSDS